MNWRDSEEFCRAFGAAVQAQCCDDDIDVWLSQSAAERIGQQILVSAEARGFNISIEPKS